MVKQLDQYKHEKLVCEMCGKKAENVFVGRTNDDHSFWLHVCEDCTKHLEDQAKKQGATRIVEK
jgi:ribosome-binding protein aMBF1 (putative translation factor)